MVHTAAGNYAKFTSTLLKDLIKWIDLNHFVTSRTIREVLQTALQKRKYKSSNDVVNAQVKPQLWIKQIKSKAESIKTSQYYEDFAHGLI